MHGLYGANQLRNIFHGSIMLTRSRTVQIEETIPGFHGWRATNCPMNLTEIVISEIQRDRSFEVLQLFTEAFVKAVKRRQCILIGVGSASRYRTCRFFPALGLRKPRILVTKTIFGRAIPTLRFDIGLSECFYDLPVIDFATKSIVNRICIGS